MKVRVKRQCDAEVGGQRKALFPDQFYELPDAEGARLVSMGTVETVRVTSRAKGKGE